MVATRNASKQKKRAQAIKRAAAKAKAKASVKCGICRKKYATPASLRRHKTKKKYSCHPRAVAERKKAAAEAKKQRNRLDYQLRKIGFTYAMYHRGN